MQPVDALTLHHLAAELDVKLADGKINKVQQASHHELLLHLWVGGEAGRQKLYINIQPNYAFCTLLEDSSFLTFPEKAANFCMVLRKHLTSARIQHIRTLPDERVLNITLDNFNELGQPVHLVLSIELMGKNSNIILYDSELNTIIGCAHGVSEQMSRFREVSVGYPYVTPPSPAKLPIRFAPRCEVTDHMEAAWTTHRDPADVLTQAYAGIGKATLADIFHYHPDADAAYDAMMDLFRGEHLYSAIWHDNSRYSLLPAHQSDPEWRPMHSINALIRQFYLSHLLADRVSATRHQFGQILKGQAKKLQKRRQELEKTDPDAIKALKKSGDLLMVAASQQTAFSGPQLTLTDYDTGEPFRIEIDPAISLSENAQQYYKRYKKAQARHTMATQMARQLDNQLGYIQELSNAVELAATPADLQPLREDLESQGWLSPLETRKKGTRPALSKPLSVLSSEGFPILVGRSNLQNEQLVGKLARSDDIWLHVHQMPGSHVLIKTDKQAVPNPTLLEAAMLAVWFSPARQSVNVPVVYTKAQYVRKIPDSYPGHVTYTHEQALHVTPLPETMETLLRPQTPLMPA